MVYDYYLREDSNGEKFLLRWDSKQAPPLKPIGSTVKQIDYNEYARLQQGKKPDFIYDIIQIA